MRGSRGQRDEFRPARAMGGQGRRRTGGAPSRRGSLKSMVGKMKVRAIAARRLKGAMRGGVGIALEFPRREALGIDPKDPYYWPTALEYGHAFPGRGGMMEGVPGSMRDVPARPYIRACVNRHKARELAAIGRDIGRAIEAEFRKK